MNSSFDSANATTPLAERVRPKALSQIIGQTHLLGENAPISRMVAQGFLPSLILYGEAGIGKTTMAQLLAQAVGRQFVALSALTLTVKELRELIDNSGGVFGVPVVFIDEIHRFNKAQQDALLGAVETGTITLIGATTENPSFSVNHALLSRCQAFKLEPLSDDEIIQVLQRAIHQDKLLKPLNIHLTNPKTLAHLAAGDARRALNLLEMALQSTTPSPQGEWVIDDALIASTAQTLLPRYDKDGQRHYDCISAMIKSVRGSDADAALYWLACMLNAGEPPEFIARRLVILASEDIGLANPNALLLADAALRSVQSIGMPEARIILSQVLIYLATSPKSNSAYRAINDALTFAKQHEYPVPLHLRNGATTFMQKQGYGQGYIYPHDYPNHYHPQAYLPPQMAGVRFYEYGDNPKEQASKAYLDWLKSQE